MVEKGKLLLILGGGLAALLALARRKPEEQVGASVSLQILDATTMEPVPRNSPAEVVEGGNYIARVTVTNRSTRGGQLIAAVLRSVFNGEVLGMLLTMVPSFHQDTYPAGGGFVIDVAFGVPDFVAPATGSVSAAVLDPAGRTLTTAQEPLTVVAVPTVYGATAVIQVV